MYKKFLIVLLFVLIISPAFSAGSSGGSSGDAKPVTQYEIALKMISKAKKFEKKNLIIPHMGWNSLKVKKDNKILSSVFDEKDFYFVHSYIFEKVKKSDVLATTKYGKNFPSVVNKGNIYGVQFHPEKSHKNGLKLIKNFILNS